MAKGKKQGAAARSRAQGRVPPRPKNKAMKAKGLGLGRLFTAPAAMMRGNTVRKPRIRQVSADSCRVRHRELLYNIQGTATYTNSLTAINPGQSTMFPWLSAMAAVWEKYKFHELRFEYLTRCGSGTVGSMYLSVDYDAVDQAPFTEQIQATYFGTKDTVPWKNITMQCDMKRIADFRYVRPGVQPPNTDIKTYDVGNLVLGTTDGSSSSPSVLQWGKLWVEYDVEFCIPQQLSSGVLVQSGIYVNTTGITDNLLLGTASDATVAAIPVAFANSATNGRFIVSQLDIGVEYLLYFYITGTVITSCVLTIVSGGTENSGFNSGINSAATSASDSMTFTATASSAVFAVNQGANTSTGVTVICTSLATGISAVG